MVKSIQRCRSLGLDLNLPHTERQVLLLPLPLNGQLEIWVIGLRPYRTLYQANITYLPSTNLYYVARLGLECSLLQLSLAWLLRSWRAEALPTKTGTPLSQEKENKLYTQSQLVYIVYRKSVGRNCIQKACW